MAVELPDWLQQVSTPQVALGTLTAANGAVATANNKVVPAGSQAYGVLILNFPPGIVAYIKGHQTGLNYIYTSALGLTWTQALVAGDSTVDLKLDNQGGFGAVTAYFAASTVPMANQQPGGVNNPGPLTFDMSLAAGSTAVMLSGAANTQLYVLRWSATTSSVGGTFLQLQDTFLYQLADHSTRVTHSLVHELGRVTLGFTRGIQIYNPAAVASGQVTGEILYTT